MWGLCERRILQRSGRQADRWLLAGDPVQFDKQVIVGEHPVDLMQCRRKVCGDLRQLQWPLTRVVPVPSRGGRNRRRSLRGRRLRSDSLRLSGEINQGRICSREMTTRRSKDGCSSSPQSFSQPGRPRDRPGECGADRLLCAGQDQQLASARRGGVDEFAGEDP